MAWSDAARRAALEARRLRKKVQPYSREFSKDARRALFKKLRVSNKIDRIVLSGGRVSLNDPLTHQLHQHQSQLDHIKKMAEKGMRSYRKQVRRQQAEWGTIGGQKIHVAKKKRRGTPVDLGVMYIGGKWVRHKPGQGF